MKRSKIITALIIIILSSIGAIAQQDSRLSLCTQINSENIDQMHLYIDAQITVETTKCDIIEVEIEVCSNQFNLGTVRHLVKEGRYSLLPLTANNLMSIKMPNLRKMVKINGVLFEDDIAITFYIPEGIEVIVHDSAEEVIAQEIKANRKEVINNLMGGWNPKS